MNEYAALSKTPHALADGLMLVFQHPVKLWDGFQITRDMNILVFSK
jgi:hypothetical protein